MLSLAVALLMVALAAAPAGAGILPRGPLRPDGRWLKDRSGRVVIVHGLQVARKTWPYAPPAESFGPADARLIRRLGFNAVRLAWFWRGLEPRRGQVDPGYVDAIARAGRLLAARDIFLLVESHQDVYGAPVRGSGFPDWATDDDGVPQSPDAGFPGNYFAPGTARAFDNLWADRDGLWSAYAAAWRRIARVFRREPMLLGYDLFNEPWPGSQWPSCAQPAGCPAFDTGPLSGLQDALAAGVRSADPRGIVFYEPHLLFDFGAASWLKPPPAAARPAGLSFHAYCLAYGAGQFAPPELAGPSREACPQADALVFRNAETTARAMGVPPLFSEFGDTDDLDVVAHYADLADAAMTGWMYWAYKDWLDVPGGPGAGSLFTDDGDLRTLKRAKVAVLSRPYPMAVAGTPLGYGFDRASRRFDLRYRPDARVRAPTVVDAPSTQYPGGYAVEVSGARVTSRPCARHLTLAARHGAREVRATLRPGRCRPRRRA